MPAPPLAAFPIWEQREFKVSRTSCSVLMPFGVPALESLYRSTLTPAIQSVGLRPHRADRSVEANVVNHIWSLLNEARVVVAETSGNNPNVLYELGIAHTLGKPTIVLRNKLTRNVPFNIRHLRHIAYAPSGEGRRWLRKELTQALKELTADFPTGHRILDELEVAANDWRGPARDFGFLYNPDQLNLVRRWVRPREMSDYALSFCVAAACQWGSPLHMVHWGLLCNRRKASAVDLAFGLANPQRRPRLRIAYLLGQMEEPTRRAVVTAMSEHAVAPELREWILEGRVADEVLRRSAEFGLSPGERDELLALFEATKLVFAPTTASR